MCPRKGKNRKVNYYYYIMLLYDFFTQGLNEVQLWTIKILYKNNDEMFANDVVISKIWKEEVKKLVDLCLLWDVGFEVKHSEE